MIKLENFNDVLSSGISYGGHSGSKRGIIWNNEKWFLKYPKSTKSMDVKNLSYTTAPLSEYIGSKIYESLGLETHKTNLGVTNGKVVVACKDFLSSQEIILDYNSIKNEYNEKVEQELEELSNSIILSNNDLDEILVVMNNNSYFKKIPALKLRFWEMFVVDALIGNNDRNEGNWGVVLNKENGALRIAPIFDNGAAFYSKSDEEKLERIYKDENRFKQSVYESSISIFTRNNKIINPLKFIENMNNNDCNQALINIVPKIDLEKFKEIIFSIPEYFDDLLVCSNIKKEFYFNALKYRYEQVLLPTYKKIIDK